MTIEFLQQRALVVGVAVLLLRMTAACGTSSRCDQVTPIESGTYRSLAAAQASSVLSPSFRTSADLSMKIDRKANTVVVEFARGTERVVETWRIDGTR